MRKSLAIERRIDPKGRITLPKRAMMKAGLREGDLVSFSIEGRRITVVKCGEGEEERE